MLGIPLRELTRVNSQLIPLLSTNTAREFHCKKMESLGLSFGPSWDTLWANAYKLGLS